MFKKKIIALLCGAVMVSGLAVGCGSGGSSEGDTAKITISGSTSVGPTMEVLAEAYQKNNDVKIEVQQPGSSAGIKNTIDGTSDLGMSSRDLKDEETADVEGTQIAIDGIAVVTNTANKVKDLTIDQVKDIFTGKITNWKEVGGSDAPIVVVSREDGSGTRDAFQEIVGYESSELIADATITDASGNLKTTVSQNENAIGFVSFSYVDDTVSAVDIEGVKPEAELAKNGTYKLSRPFLVVTKKDTLTENGQKLIDFILSEEGQKIVEEDKLITVK